MAGGPAVFKARALYAQIDPQQSYDDAILCLQQGLLLREQKEDENVQIIKVYPNPTTGLVTIIYKTHDESNVSFKLYSTMGEILFSENLNNNQTKQIINVSAFNNGVYYYTIESKKKTIDKGKLIILK